MSGIAIKTLEAINNELQQALDELWRDATVAASPRTFASVLTVLQRGSEVRRALSTELAGNPDIVAQLKLYRRHLEELGEVLPRIQGRLLAERARLEGEQSHLAAASAWVQANQKTL